MKRLLLTTTTLFALTGLSYAADMAVKAPAVLPAPVPAVSWTGIYIGIGGGYGWGTTERSWNQNATYDGLVAQDPTGLIFPPRGTPFTPASYATLNSSNDINGGFFGGQIGGDYQIGWAVLGLQADAHWADIEGRDACFGGAAIFLGGGFASPNCGSKVTAFGSVTGRLGAAVDRALIYVKGGWAWERVQHDFDPQWTDFGAGTSLSASSATSTRHGWTFGAGVEYAFAPNWSAFVELSHYEFSSDNDGLSLTYVNPGLAPAFNTTYAYNNGFDSKDTFNVVKAGVNYRFNWGAPVVARY